MTRVSCWYRSRTDEQNVKNRGCGRQSSSSTIADSEDASTQSIAEEMRESGLAHRYMGGFKPGWC